MATMIVPQPKHINKKSKTEPLQSIETIFVISPIAVTAISSSSEHCFVPNPFSDRIQFLSKLIGIQVSYMKIFEISSSEQKPSSESWPLYLLNTTYQSPGS